jgi:RNA polymerase sigma factor (sigma-70 family)
MLTNTYVSVELSENHSENEISYRPCSLSSQKYLDQAEEHYAERDGLYHEFQPLVNRLIRQYGGSNSEMRRDLSGEIYYRFCSLYDAWDSERGVPLRPYLVRQLNSSIYTWARKRWRDQSREYSLDQIMMIKEPGEPEDPTGKWNDTVFSDQVAHKLPEAISLLPKRQKQVVIWRYYDQLSYVEIASILGVQVSTARSLLRHGLNGLRRALYHDI